MMLLPLRKSTFSLDTSGVAGFFGGDEAVSAMATVHIYEGRKWLGWYNSPGSYTVAKRYGQLAKSRLWDALFPGVNVDPAKLFEYDGKHGPEFIGSYSGSHIKDTGHVGYLFLSECRSLPSQTVKGRTTKAVSVTIAKLGQAPPEEVEPRLRRKWSTVLSAVPILASAGACIACALFKDWYCFSMILLGSVSSGFSCMVIGNGTLTFTHPKPAEGSPRGDGVLHYGEGVVVLIGEEGAVNSVTRGQFSLRYSSAPKYHAIGFASMLLTTQFLLQLLLIPQGTLFGQIMFLASLAVSWLYSCYLSSLDREQIQRSLLLKEVMPEKPSLKRYSLGTRTAMAVFTLLHLQPPEENVFDHKILDHIIPNDTPTWKTWKEVILSKLARKEPLSFREFDYRGAVGRDRDLLRNLYDDTQAAYDGYMDSLDMSEKDLSDKVEP